MVEPMANEFTAILERDEDWFIAYCPEIPGANGQGKTKDEAKGSLADAIALILQDRLEDGLRGVPEGTPGKVLVSVGLTWIRYRVRFGNGVELGSLDRAVLLSTREWGQRASLSA